MPALKSSTSIFCSVIPTDTLYGIDFITFPNMSDMFTNAVPFCLESNANVKEELVGFGKI